MLSNLGYYSNLRVKYQCDLVYKVVIIIVPPQDKYKRILDSADAIVDRREYHGLVPVHMLCEPKTIEESMSEIRQKKKQKSEHAAAQQAAPQFAQQGAPQFAQQNEPDEAAGAGPARTIKFT